MFLTKSAIVTDCFNPTEMRESPLPCLHRILGSWGLSERLNYGPHSLPSDNPHNTYNIIIHRDFILVLLHIAV